MPHTKRSAKTTIITALNKFHGNSETYENIPISILMKQYRQIPK